MRQENPVIDALETLVRAIDYASPKDLDEAIQHAWDEAGNFSRNALQRRALHLFRAVLKQLSK